MKKIFAVAVAAAFALSVAGLAVAAEKTSAPAGKAAPAAGKAPAAKKATQLTGTIESIDAAAGTFSMKGKKGVLNLTAGEKVKLGDLKVGDKVVVKHADGTALSVKAVKGKAPKAKKETPAVESKPASKPAEKK